MSDLDGWLDPLIDRVDIDGLIRAVEDLCSQRAWPYLLALRDRCRRAAERGRQLWPIAALAEYRLCLLGPAGLVAAVLENNTGWPVFGPLTEVAASRLAWADLAPHLGSGPLRAFVAHERIIRGEALDDADFDDHVLDLPRRLQSWEPAYPLAVYHPERLEFDEPAWPPLTATRPTGDPVDVLEIDDELIVDAVRDVVQPWTADSNGRCEIIAVEGEALDAIGALGVHRVQLAEVDLATALAHTVWAAASGGAHGRRRGAARARFAAWWLMAALIDRIEEWPLPPDQLHAEAGQLRWYLWDAGEPRTGWQWRMAVADVDPDTGETVSWAWSAIDQA
jgi:hypothetical protein